jgi:hypothetical protein
MSEKKRKIRRIDPNGRKWQRLAIKMAVDFCPRIYACIHCSYPVILGYCCETCGSVDPQGIGEK